MIRTRALLTVRSAAFQKVDRSLLSYHFDQHFAACQRRIPFSDKPAGESGRQLCVDKEAH